MPTKLPALLSLSGADLAAADDAARLLADASPWLACSTLLAAVDAALVRGETPWALLDAAERIVSDLRLEHGCEEWHAADWSQAAVQDTALLHDTCVELRRRARALRDAHLPSLRRAG